MKDLFFGAFGRLNNHGGSPMFTTPNTVFVPPEYEVETDVPSVAEFVTCSLDGRLWVWKRSRRYYVATLRWDEDTQRLVFVETTIFNNLNIIGRGIDWILAENTIIQNFMILQASDDEPYMLTGNLFADNGENFLYSMLRSKVLQSGIDTFTKAAWGLSDTNGNSEGYGYFNRSALLQSVNKHYSLLQTIGDWNIIGNFLVRRLDNPILDSHNSMLNIRPLLPLEFYRNNPVYGTGFGNDINLTCYDDELWGRGLYHIGRCYILPAVFDEKGTPQEFYLYISPDYPISPYKSNSSKVTKDEWLNITILHTGAKLYCFLAQQDSSLSNTTCYSSDEPKVFAPKLNEWLNFADEGAMFIDTLHNSGLVLIEDGAILLNGDNTSYECNGLQQWLAPAGKVDFVTCEAVVSSWDNSNIVTYFQQGFHREMLTSKVLPYSASFFTDKYFSVGVNKSALSVNLSVNTSKNTHSFEPIEWDNIFRQPITIKMLSAEAQHYIEALSIPAFISDFSTTTTLAGYLSYNNDGKQIILASEDIEAPIITVPKTIGWGTDAWGNTLYPGFSYTVSFSGFYVDPDSAQFIPFSAKTSFSSHIPVVNVPLPDGTPRYYYDYYAEDIIVDIPLGVSFSEGYIGVVYTHCTNGGHTRRGEFKPLLAVPSKFSDWHRDFPDDITGNLSLLNFYIPERMPSHVTCSASAVFREGFSGTTFLCNNPSAFYYANNHSSGRLANLDNINFQFFNYYNLVSVNKDNSFYSQGLHIVTANLEHFFVFRSDIDPKIFDFYAEVERSKLS